MNTKLNGIKVWPGVIGSHRSATHFGLGMELAFGKRYMKLTGDIRANMPSHNFGIVKYYGELWVGESVPPVAKLTSFANYERFIEDGEIRNVQLFEVCEVNRRRQAAAATWWVENVLGKDYDSDAFPRLILKAIFGDWFPQAAGKDWKWWCTEGWKDAYKIGAHFDLYENENPTPFTTIKRWMEGQMRLLT